MKGKGPVRHAFPDVYSRCAARQELYATIKRAPSPSDSVKSASAVKDVTISPSGPRYGRPSHRYGPPTALFSEPLALLEYNLGQLESLEPDPGMLDYAFRLITISTDFFADEDQREASLKEIMRGLLPGHNEWQRPTPGKTAKPDGLWLQGPFAYIIVELKNEPGLGGDPFLQSLVSYGKFTAQKEVLFVPPPNNFPPLIHVVVRRPTPRTVQLSCHSPGHRREPSRHIDGCCNRRNICRRTPLGQAPPWAPRSR